MQNNEKMTKYSKFSEEQSLRYTLLCIFQSQSSFNMDNLQVSISILEKIIYDCTTYWDLEIVLVLYLKKKNQQQRIGVTTWHCSVDTALTIAFARYYPETVSALFFPVGCPGIPKTDLESFFFQCENCL